MEMYLKMLLDHRYDITEQRKYIIRYIIRNSDLHMTTAEIYDGIQQEGLEDEANLESEDLGYSTVQRTVKIFTKVGALIEHHFFKGMCRYELAPIDGHAIEHGHFICLSCDTIEDIEIKVDEKPILEVVEENKFKYLTHKVTIYGYCEYCKENFQVQLSMADKIHNTKI